MKGYKVTDGELTVIDMPNDVAPNQVKIKVDRVTISRNDILAYAKKASSNVLGRQCTGMVIEVGTEVINFIRGDRVVLSPYIACGECRNCREGKYNICENFEVVGHSTDGYLRDFVVINSDRIFKLPEQVKYSEAIFVEQIAIARNVINTLNLQKGQHLVIVGGSITGLILAQLTIYYQAIPILIDSDEYAIKLAQNFGVVYTINQVSTDPKKRILSITGGRMSEKAVLIASSRVSVNRCLSFIMRGGSIVVVDSNNEYDDKLDATNPIKMLLAQQANLVGVSNGYQHFMPAINMLANKNVRVEGFVSAEIEFEDVPKYIESMSKSPYEYIKVVVKL